MYLVHVSPCKISSPLNLCFREILLQMECDIKIVGSQIYKGTIHIKYKVKYQIEEFIVICSEDIGQKDIGATCFTGKRKLNWKKESQEPTISEDSTSDVEDKRKKLTSELEPSVLQSTIEIKELKYRLPQITLSNVRSLPNKMDELKELLMITQDNFFFNTSDLIFFTETWLKENSCDVTLTDFEYDHRRLDRNKEKTKKSKGGGLITYIKMNWADYFEMEAINTPNYELLSLFIKPMDHPEDSPALIFIFVYIPGRKDIKDTRKTIHGHYETAEINNHGPVFLLGDFNKCNVTLKLEQYVKCPTRGTKTLDLCYGNVPGAYRCVCSRPLGKSDHNVIHLLPKDNPKSDCKDDVECTHKDVKDSEEERARIAQE